MSGYFEKYGVGESRREGRVRWVIGSIVAAAILGYSGWYIGRTFSEERVVKKFLGELESKNYAEAYKFWGCSVEKPCRDYSFEKFQGDWGGASAYADVSDVSIAVAEPCGNTVWVSIKHPKEPELGLSVDPETNQISYTPETRCPGVWRLRELPARFAAFMKRQREADAPPGAPGH